jgi:hypothetical protein
VLEDFDDNGYPDAALVNGGIRRSASVTSGQAAVAAVGPYWAPYAQRNQVFSNPDGRRFVDVSEANPALCGTPNVGRGLISGDLDNDGAIDLVVTVIDGPARVLRNVAPRAGHWIAFRAVDPARGGRDAYGAVVRFKAGGRQFVAPVNPAYSYLCSCDPRPHVGLGSVANIDSLTVTWPDGTTEPFGPPPGVDRLVVLRKGTGSTGAAGSPAAAAR